MTEKTASAWKTFWDHGRWWKAALAVVLYLILYTVASQVVLLVGGDVIDRTNLLATAVSVFVGIGGPLIIGAVILIGFIVSVRWTRPLFARQPVTGRWWMWIIVALTIVPIVLRFAGIDYGSYAGGVVVTMLLVGLFIGFTEEILYRGIVVTILRSAGQREWTVALLSSLFFALSHTVNLLGGQPILTVALTVVFTFGFGLMMYLVMRATGNIVWAMLIHGLTDPTTILATGGVDSAAASAAHSPLLDLASPFNIVFVVAALIALIFIRGKATDRAEVTASTR